LCYFLSFLFFVNASAPTEIYPLSLHDALPILRLASINSTSPPTGVHARPVATPGRLVRIATSFSNLRGPRIGGKSDESIFTCCRSEEHTSELQSRSDLVCRLLLEKKKKKKQN